MKRILAFISFIILISTVFFFWFKSTNRTQYYSLPLLKLFSIKSSNDFYINIPESKVKCKINELKENNLEKIAFGTYTSKYEKGSVSFYYTQINALNTNSTKYVYFIAPFSVSNQGSGIFYYLGLFLQDIKHNKIIHKDSFFLGDRILINSIKTSENKVNIEYYFHLPKQAMSENPKKLNNINLKINKEHFIK